MDDNGLGEVVLGALAVLMFISIVLIPLGILLWWLAYGKESHKKLQKEKQEAQQRLIEKGIVRADKFV